MTEKERMLSGQLYMPCDEELRQDFLKARKITRLYNLSSEEDLSYRMNLLKELFRQTGESLYIEPPFRCDYGGNITVGEGFYANFDCIILDVCEVVIGNNVMFGPRVGVYTAGHPIDASVRNEGLEFGKTIKIGDNVWIGANSIILPGVTIGNNVVIGAGSVVVRDIPDDVIAVGSPCDVLRPITEDDTIYWQEQKRAYMDSF